MKESYCPGIFEKSRADQIINIEDEEAYHMARVLAKEEGMFVGMSSGAAMTIALKIAKEKKQGRIVVILPDGGERYLSTPLFVAKETSGMSLYNTMTRKKEEFVPIHEKRVKIYTCGPTLCQLIHIGQSRRLVFSDLLRRYLEFKGYNVTHIMNVTDLDDRTIEGADKAGQSLRDFTEGFYQEFLKDLDILRIKRASEYPKASEYVEDMIGVAQKLMDKGYAYEKLRSVYFDISRFADYGKLSKIDLDKIRLGKTVDLEVYEKGNPRDFTLLKRATLHELKKGIFYKTKWGNIRPSWHLECPTMAMKLLGDTYDIHMSGSDLIFPHHENTIAISEAVTGKSPAHYWLHNELVMVEGKKPSRGSDHDTYTIRRILEQGYTGRVIRFWLLSRHYRKPISFSWSSLHAAKNTVTHLDLFVEKLRYSSPGGPHPEMDQLLYNLKHKFIEAMDDDLNMALALASLFEFIREINRVMDRKGLSIPDRQNVEEGLQEINSVLDILDLEPSKSGEEVEERVKKREEARKKKDWATADRIRQELKDMGIEVIDTNEGSVWRKERG
jgi:cysteinyl-tRNA synthetase